MNNSELNDLLKSADVPSRPAEYWERFPGRVGAALRRRAVAPEMKNYWFPRLIWGLSAAAACLLVGFGVGHWRGRVETAGSSSLLQNVKVIREMMAMFPNQIRAIVQDERGLSLVLSDRGDVPDSPPLFVQVIQDGRRSSWVTFSGQEVQIAGQKVTVLSDAKGSVMLVGDRFIWSGAGPAGLGGDVKIQARTLAYAL